MITLLPGCPGACDRTGPSRPAAVDVHYPPAGGAVGALVVAQDLSFTTARSEHVVGVDQVAPYRPGHFADRELPVLRALLAEAGDVDLLVIDGYVDLDPAGRPGLGAHAHHAFGIPVIGVAKTPFRSATHAIAVRRGTAVTPLRVTAAGLDPQQAARIVREMAGGFRIPALLHRVDALARGGRPAAR